MFLCRDYETKEISTLTKENEIFMFHLSSYALSFPTFQNSFHIHKRQKEADDLAKQSGDLGLQLLNFSQYGSMTLSDLASSDDRDHKRFVKWILNKKDIRSGTSMDRARQYFSSRKSSSDSQVVVCDDEGDTLMMSMAKIRL